MSFIMPYNKDTALTAALQIAQQALITKNTSIVKSQRSPDGTIVFVSSKIELPVNISNILDHPFPSPCRRGLGRGYSVPSVREG